MTEAKEPPAGLVPRFPRKKVNSTRALPFSVLGRKSLLGLKQRAARTSPLSRVASQLVPSPVPSPCPLGHHHSLLLPPQVMLPLPWDRLQLVAATPWLPGKGAGFYSFPPHLERVREETPTEISEGHEQR